jgi:hypothetical protein
MQPTNYVTSNFFSIGILVAFIIIAVLFLLTQYKALKAIRPENRLMQPGLVWLQLIPVFGQIWQFFAVTKIAGSIREEITSRQDDSILGVSDAAVDNLDKRPTYKIGIAYCILFTINLIMAANPFEHSSNPSGSGLIGLASMTCWVIYWVQLAKWKRKLVRIDI